MLLVGVDIGTQGTKAGVFDAAGRCVAEAFEESRRHEPGGGVVEEDPERQVGSVCRTVRACVKSLDATAADIAAIGIDGQMAGVIGVGAAGRHVTPYDSWLDTRCGEFIDVMHRKAGRRIVAKTGNPPSFNHGPKKLWWMNRRRRTFRQIVAFVQPGGYAAMRLVGLDGAQAFVDTTYLHFSGFADNAHKRWDASLIKAFHFDREKLPRIVEPHDVVGELTPRMARRCGLRAGVPVVAGCGDTAASFLACGATTPGVCVDVAGTASVFAATTRAFVPDTEHGVLGCGRSATPGLWHPYAYINGGGMNLEWFRDHLAGGGDLAELDRAAAKLGRGTNGPLFVPHLAGRVSPPQPGLRGAWVGLTWRHDRADLYRAALEAVALEYRVYRDTLRSLAPSLRLRELRVTGGGQRSALWNRIKADALGMNVRPIRPGYGAPMGVAMLAGFGVGVFKSLPAAAKRWVRPAQAVRPDRKLASHYAGRVDRYRGLLERLDAAA